MVVRYMGTKRYMADRVHALVSDVNPEGRVVDLFSGVGAVVEGLADLRPVMANDLLAFTGCLARARFTSTSRLPVRETIEILKPEFRTQSRRLARLHAHDLSAERIALDSGWRDLKSYMDRVPHAGDTSTIDLSRVVAKAAASDGMEHYRMAALYFGASYLSVAQAIEVDALRFAIDRAPNAIRDWLLSAWISAVATCINAPGHAAQYLRSHDPVSYERVRRAWNRSIWGVFCDRLTDVKLVGSARWRSQNVVTTEEARTALTTHRKIGLVYADPPYTKDQYSRYYHVYESLYLYDFPESRACGRYRQDRFVSDFSLRSRVRVAFDDLIARVQERKVPLILSYPSNGLLIQAGTDLHQLLRTSFRDVKRIQLTREHSTMGGRRGVNTKSAIENLYVCT